MGQAVKQDDKQQEQGALDKAEAKPQCFLPTCTNDADGTIEAEVAPGVKTELPICSSDRVGLEEAQRQAAIKVRAEAAQSEQSAAPHGTCHVCKMAVGVRVEGVFYDDRDENVETFWEHDSDDDSIRGKRCHEKCGCNLKDANGNIVGKHRERRTV